MRRTLQRWLSPPVFADDELTRRAALLNAILWTTLMGSLLTSPLVLSGPPAAAASRLATLAAIAGLALVLQLVLRRGRVAATGVAVVVGLWIIVTAAIAVGGNGVRSLGYPSYLILILIAGLLLGKRAGLAFAALGAVLGLAFIYADSTGLLSETARPDTSLETWVIDTILFASAAVLLYLALVNRDQALGRARQELAERQRTEVQLRQLSRAVEQSSASIIIAAANGLVQYVNPRFTQVSGYTLAEAVGQKAELLKSSEMTREEIQHMWATLAAEGQWRGEFHNHRKNGERYWESALISPVHDAGGAVINYVAVLEDVTDRKQHERELQVITTLSGALRSAETVPQMLAVVLEQILSLLAVAAATIELVEPETGDARVELAYGPWQAMVGQRIPFGTGLNSYIQASGQPYVNNNVLSDPRTLDHLLYQGYHAAAGVPLNALGQIIGYLWIGHQHDISRDDVRLLMAMADIAANAIRRARLHIQTEARARRLAALHEIDLAITSSLDLSATLDLLAGHALVQLAAEAAVILRLDPVSHTLLPVAARERDGRPLSVAARRLGEQQAALAVQTQRLVGLPTLPAEGGAFAESGPFADGLTGLWVAPLLARGKMLGVLEVFQRAALPADSEWLNFLNTLAGQAAVAIENSALIDNLQRSNQELSQAYDATIEGWSRALDLRDHETEGHTQRVAEQTLKLARAMGIDPAQQAHIRRGALLHDMGKLAIPDPILLKPAALSADEWVIMRRHPEYAYQLLAPIDYLRPVLDIPYCHHEKWDGSGYPRQLKGEAIPLSARIFAVVDVWDALRSDRPYRPGWPEAKVRDYLREQAGRHFDPAVVEVFLSLDLPA